MAGMGRDHLGHEQWRRLEVRGVSKAFVNRRGERRDVIGNVDFELRAGERVALLGATGSGKTTLLNIIAGFTQPSRGRVSVDGVEVRGPGPDRGVVFQRPNLYPWMTAKQNLTFGARWGSAERVGKSELEASAATLLEALGLGDAADLFPRQMSGGMQARVALGRVLLCRSTKILLMDEPFGALDALTRSGLHRLMLDLRASEGDVSAILVTHDVEEAVLLSDRLLILGDRPCHLVGEMEVPFGWPRSYSECLLGGELQAIKGRALAALAPSIMGTQ